MSRTKICGACREEKPLDHYWPTKTGRIPWNCKPCSAASVRLWRQRHLEEARRRDRVRSARRRGALGMRYAALKNTARSHDRALDITRDDLAGLMNRGCEYCGRDLWATATGYCLDRIDPAGGYTKDNVLPCCGTCNRIRYLDFSCDEMREIGPFVARVLAARDG